MMETVTDLYKSKNYYQDYQLEGSS